MTDDLYERYKAALRTGHVAVLRGSLDEAIAAYHDAAEIAPSRALPHTSLGGVLLRLGHLEEALSEFAEAVALSPHDEGALLGQAEALTAAGMRADAAAALDHVAEIQEASGRLPESADTLRRAIELDESPQRTRRQRALLREIRFAGGDHAAEQLLARALRLRDEPGSERRTTEPVIAAAGVAMAGQALQRHAASREPTEPEAAEPEPVAAESEAAEPEPVAAEGEAADGATPDPEWMALAEPSEAAAEPEAEPAVAEVEPEAAEPVAVGAEAEAEPVGVEAGAEAEGVEAERELEPEQSPLVGVMEGIDDTTPVIAAAESGAGDGTHQPSGDELLAAAEAAEQAGDDAALRSLLIWASRAYALEGRFEAGLDAANRLLARNPADVDAHLVLVELYVARSWDNLAGEKLRLLDRLAQLNDDQETHERLCAVASRAFPNDPALQRICS